MAKRKVKEPTAAQLARRAQRERLGAQRAQRKLDALARDEHRKLAREKLAGLRKKLGEAIDAKKIRIKALLETIREQRAELRIELKATRKRILEELKDKLREERAAARVDYLKQKEDARRAATSDVARARAALAAERQHQSEERRIAREARVRHAEHAKAMAHPEFDNVVGAKAILGAFGPLYERVKDTLPTLRGQTRAEAFLDYAQKKPEELHAALEPKAEAAIEKTKAEIAEVEKALTKPEPHHLAHAARKVRERVASSPTRPTKPARKAGGAKARSGLGASVKTAPTRKKGQLPRAESMSLDALVRERQELKVEREQRKKGKTKPVRIVATRAANSNDVPANVTASDAKGYGYWWTDSAGRRSWIQRGDPNTPARTGTQVAAKARAQKLQPASKNDAGHGARPDRQPVERPPLPVSKLTEKTVKAPEVRDHAVLAKMIKDEIKAAAKAGLLPEKATYSVRSQGNSIRVRASNLPFPVTNEDAFYVQPGANYMTYDIKHYASRETLEAQAVRKKLEAIVDAYHWDKSDLASDYHNSRFFKDVALVEDSSIYNAIEAKKLAASRQKGWFRGRDS